jgi:4-hydroxy-tetrahydrodipicolinate synthase
LRAIWSGCKSLFEAVADVVDVPLILQNAPPPLGPALAPALILLLLAEIPAIRYVKEECLPSGARITSLLSDAPATLSGVFGGAGGRYILGELARGITGCMPSCECTEIHAAILSAYGQGQEEQARAIFDQLVPLLNFVSVFRAAGVKEVLRQRGIIDCARHRGARIPALDDYDRRELAAIIAKMQHLWGAESLRAALD